MKKKALFLLFLLFCTNSFSQNILNSHSFSLNSRWNNYKEVFPIVNEENKKIVLLIGDKKNYTIYKYRPDFTIIDSLFIEKPSKKFSLIGGTINDNNYSIYSATSNYSEIYSETFNFKTKKTSSATIKLSLKKETILQSFSQNNTFYLLSLLKNKNQMKLYSFDETGHYTEHPLDFSSFLFVNSKHQQISLDQVFNIGTTPTLSIEKMNHQSPNSLSKAAKTKKMYFIDDQLILTFDYSSEYTQAFVINLNTYNITEKKFIQPKLKTNKTETSIKSNSFLYKDKLYQITSSKEDLSFSVKDYNSEKTILKEYYIGENDTINFKNSDIIQKNGFLRSNRSLKTTNLFLKKITALNIAVTVYETSQNIIVKIGSTRTPSASISSTGKALGMTGSKLTKAITNAPASSNFNTSSNNYKSYHNKKSVYIDCLFDKNMNHKPVEIEPIAFDKINQFYYNEKALISAKTIFKHNDTFVIGYYDTYDEKYILRKFTD